MVRESVNPYIPGPTPTTGSNCYVHGKVAPTIRIGAESGNNLIGRMAHFTIYGRGLTDEEIEGLMAGVNPLSIDGAVHYWPMLDGTGDITDTVNSVTVPMVGTVGTDAADNPPVEVIGGPAVPDMLLSLSPAADGNQRISDPAGALPPALPTVPQAPESLSVDDVAANYVTVSWEYKGTTHTGFKTQYRLPAQGGVWLDGDTLKISDRTWTRLDLPADTNVDVRIMAFNAVGNSAPADISTVTGPPNTETNLGKILVYENLAGIPLNLNWNGYVPFGTSSTKGSQEVASLTADRVGMNEIKVGEDGFGKWGFTYDTPSFSAREGDEIWFRVYELHPIGYDHYAYGGGGRLKWFRFRMAQIEGGAISGYNELYMDYKENSRWVNHKEGATDTKPAWMPMGSFDPELLYADGKWHSFEVYVKFSMDTDVGEMRFWIDGELMGKANRATLDDPAKSAFPERGPFHCVALYYHTYWNGLAPKTQRTYYDNIAIAMNIAGGHSDRQWLEADASGFPFIGSKVQ